MKDQPNKRNGPGFDLVRVAWLAFGGGLLLVGCAGLRENPMFWRQAGGYPLWLRDWVLWIYMPLLIGTVGLLCGLSIAGLLWIVSTRRLFVGEFILVLLGWGLVLTSGCISFRNNVRNIITGAPIHSHPQAR